MDEIIIRYIDMPIEIKGMTLLDEDDNFNMYINDRHAANVKHETYLHELAHIKRNDHRRFADIREKETIGIPEYICMPKPDPTKEMPVEADLTPVMDEAERIRKRIEKRLRERKKRSQRILMELEHALERYRFFNSGPCKRYDKNRMEEDFYGRDGITDNLPYAPVTKRTLNNKEFKSCIEKIKKYMAEGREPLGFA
jgi:hypothetical protein